MSRDPNVCVFFAYINAYLDYTSSEYVCKKCTINFEF